MTLGEKLYALRKKSGLSQEQLAEILNVSRQSISKWEGNVTYPEADKLVALSEYFQVSLDYLMKADKTDETKTDIGKASARDAAGTSDVSGDCVKKDKREPMLTGIVLCIAGVIGIICMGLMTIFLPDTTEAIGASSVITLNGNAFLMLFFVGVMLVGAGLILQIIRRK